MSKTFRPFGMSPEFYRAQEQKESADAQTKQLRRIADALEALVALELQEREQYDTTESPPSADLSGRPLSLR